MQNTYLNTNNTSSISAKHKNVSSTPIYIGIKKIGVFCHSKCHKTQMKPEHTEIFNSIKDALMHGYYPCKICYSLIYNHKYAIPLKKIIDKIQQTPTTNITKNDLEKYGIDHNYLNRWFIRYHDITFHTFLRLLRIAHTFGSIQANKQKHDVVLVDESNNIPNIDDNIKKWINDTHVDMPHNETIMLNRIITPLGVMLAGATSQGLCLLEFIDRRMLKTQYKRLYKIFKAKFKLGMSDYFEVLQNQLNDYFHGTLKIFDIPLCIKGTLFQKKAWQALLDIPYGETRSYKEQAINVKNPQAVRAIANANGDNRISIIIPCHRIIGHNGALVGYGGGLWRKKYLLDLEKSHR